jgi:hypothetical protein
MRTYTVTLHDPRRRASVPAVHEDLTRADADELTRK